MIEFESTLKIDELVKSVNIAELLSDKDLERLGHETVRLYDMDRNSREEWEQRKEQQFKLALQVAEKKSFPWQGASNIKFPLITIASLQYHARAYPALISGTDVVRCRVIGDDKDGQKEKRAQRVERHMSYQLLESEANWEEEQDKVLLTQPIIGCAFKKTYYDANIGEPVSENILARDLVVSYYTKSIETASRITHVLYRTKNDIYERVANGLYLDWPETKLVQPVPTKLKIAEDKTHGLNQPNADPAAPIELLEMHCFLDLDGDGYEEPYIITVRKDNKRIYRIVARYFESGIVRGKGGKILRIKAEQYFTKFPFIPSPDGGFYDLGFGDLLGPLNDSINTLINQLVDAGTMANTAGGFISRGIKIRGGNLNFAPLEWKHVESTGDDLRKGIVPLPVREPSQVLFTLLSLLIDYGERIGGAVDVLAGKNPGQNTPAETTRNMTEQGLKIFNGIFKRTYRALKEEFRKLYRLNQLYLHDDVKLGGQLLVARQDYEGDPKDVVPSADPNVVSTGQRLQRAMMVKESAMTTPGYNKYEVERNFLEALEVSDIDVILPDPKGPNAVPPMPNPKMLEVQIKEKKLQLDAQQQKIDMQLQSAKLMQEAELIKGKVEELHAKAAKALAEAGSKEAGHQVALINAEIALQKGRYEGTIRAAELLHNMIKSQRELDLKELEIDTKASQQTGGTNK